MDEERDVDEAYGDGAHGYGSDGMAAPGWEVPEFLAAGLLVTVGVLLATSFVGAVIGIFQPIPANSSVLQLNGYVLVYSTSWATVATSLVVIVALVLCWWQVHQAVVSPDDPVAIARLPRLGWMTSLGGFLLVLLAIGSIATFVGTLFLGGSPTSNVSWERYVSVGGGAFAVLVLTVFGLVAARRVNEESDSVLATGDDDDPGAEEPGAEEAGADRPSAGVAGGTGDTGEREWDDGAAGAPEPPPGTLGTEGTEGTEDDGTPSA